MQIILPIHVHVAGKPKFSPKMSCYITNMFSFLSDNKALVTSFNVGFLQPLIHISFTEGS